MSRLRQLPHRVIHSAVVWGWAWNGLRLAGGLILLPLVVRYLPRPDLGIYYVFLSLTALVPIIDFGFSGTLGRFVSYAMGGATELTPHGVGPPAVSGTPNPVLLWQLLSAARRLYRRLTLLAFLTLGGIGTYIVGLRIQETSVPVMTWVAWAVTLGAAVVDIYASWWGAYLRGLNQVVSATRIQTVVYAGRVVIAAVLLAGGVGLLSLPVAVLVTSIGQRFLARRRCWQVLTALGPRPAAPASAELLRVFWPNSWRLGLQLTSGFLGANTYMLICVKTFGLEANATYGLSVQLLNIVAGMAAVWTVVVWPLIGQYQARHDFAGLRRLFWPKVWLQTATFLLLAGLVVGGATPVLRWLGTDKQVLPTPWLLFLGLNGFLDMQVVLWTTLISTQNRIPSLWPVVATNLIALLLTLGLVRWGGWYLEAFVVAPLVAGSLFNYWYWPAAGARALRTTWARFMFHRQG